MAVMSGASSEVGNDVRREPVVEIAAVLQLHLLDGAVAHRLQRATLDLALGQQGMDGAADVIGRDDTERTRTSPVSRSTSTLATAQAQPKAG